VFYEVSMGDITFLGGEPLLQGGFLIARLQAFGARGFHLAVDTIGAYIKFLPGLRKRHPVFFLPYHQVEEEKYRRLGVPYPLAGLTPLRVSS